jgi:hypothetical protein
MELIEPPPSVKRESYALALEPAVACW